MSAQYHKIITVWERDPATNNKTLIEERWATPEFAALRDIKWLFTEKVDGTNIRVILRADGQVEFRGKTDEAQIPPYLLKRLGELFVPRYLRDAFPEGEATLYGEGFGPKIQKDGGNYGSEVDFCLFDVFCGGLWLKRIDVEDVGSKLRLQVAPVYGWGRLELAIDIARLGFRSRWGDFMAEGLVMRPEVELMDRRGNRIITKIKHKDFARP